MSLWFILIHALAVLEDNFHSIFHLKYAQSVGFAHIILFLYYSVNLPFFEHALCHDALQDYLINCVQPLAKKIK